MKNAEPDLTKELSGSRISGSHVPGVDFESIRHRVKLLKDSGDTRFFENRDGVRCPVCEEPFDEALETEARTRQLQPLPNHRLCLVREADRTVVFTHAHSSSV
jgi:hypothetical protein